MLVSSVSNPYRAVGVHTSVGKTVSVPYRNKGVCPVDVLRVVLSVYKTRGNSFAQRPIHAESLLFKLLMILLLLDSACPFACGYLGVNFTKVMFHRRHNAYVFSLINYDPLSHTISKGTPNLHTMFPFMNEITSLDVTCQNASASIHLEK